MPQAQSVFKFELTVSEITKLDRGINAQASTPPALCVHFDRVRGSTLRAYNCMTNSGTVSREGGTPDSARLGVLGSKEVNHETSLSTGSESDVRKANDIQANPSNSKSRGSSSSSESSDGDPKPRSQLSWHTNDTRMLVSADGTRIYANAVGDPSKQAIVFIHGFCWSLIAFDDIFEDRRWTSKLYLVRYDVRGHGRSGKPDTDAAWESKRLAEDFDAVVCAFKLCRPFVAGWSLGSAHLMDILSFHPVDYVSGIINIAGAPYVSPDMLLNIGTPFVSELIERMTQGPTVEDFQNASEEFIRACCRTLPYEVRRKCLGSIMTQPRSMMVRSVKTREQDLSTFERVGRTRVPCLVIYGEEDELVLVRKLPGYYWGWRNAKVEVLKGGSHMPWSKTDRAVGDEFCERMLEWIEGVVRGRTLARL
ncbi:hypothetical protein NP233_g9676 [Leucocoprinus birnbaumii]|uniref:AB hydrolase-1 domain-containing protein n=1 Tax=Leucocoprinus birnbaumii TaxID=56174 RepID=A0AAD5VJS7_9AGAR|nr:hypothetical protein NP233_g9676 [Leucocoprinus birnbaumii]